MKRLPLIAALAALTALMPLKAAAQPTEVFDLQDAFSIQSISFANVGVNNDTIAGFGEELIDQDMRLLLPRVELKRPVHMLPTLLIKIVDTATGATLSDADSPDGYTYAFSFDGGLTSESSITFSPWGDEEKSAFAAGNYSYQVWRDSTVIFSQPFTVAALTGKTKKIKSKGISLSIANVSLTGINAQGELLPSLSDCMTRLSLRLIVNATKNSGWALLKFRITDQNGNVVRNAASPALFSFNDRRRYTKDRAAEFSTQWGGKYDYKFKEGTYTLEIYQKETAKKEKLLYTYSFQVGRSVEWNLADATYRSEDSNSGSPISYGTRPSLLMLKQLVPTAAYTSRYFNGSLPLTVTITPDDSTAVAAKKHSANVSAEIADGAGSVDLGRFANVPPTGFTEGRYKITVTDHIWNYTETAHFFMNPGLEIKGIDFFNCDEKLNTLTPAGSPLNTVDMRYLVPRMTYSSGFEGELPAAVKIFKPDGSLFTAKSSPKGFTYKADYSIKAGDDNRVTLGGWGSKDKSMFETGDYRFQLWIDESVACDTTFSVFEKLKLNAIEFANGNYDNSLISGFGEPLVKDLIRYVTPKITLSTVLEGNHTFFFKIFRPDGTQMKSASDENGAFTYSCTKKLKVGTNTLKMSGFGNKTQSNYTEGIHKLEVWLDNDSIGSYPFLVHKQALTITSLELGNINFSGDAITGYGEPLFASEMRFLGAKAKCNSITSGDVTLDIKIISPDGTLIRGLDSPGDYTLSQTVTLKKGENEFKIKGHGSDNTSAYDYGIYKYEVWSNGSLIYETSQYIIGGDGDFDIEFDTYSTTNGKKRYHRMAIDKKNKTITLYAKSTHQFKIVSMSLELTESEVVDNPVIYTYNCVNSKGEEGVVVIDTSGCYYFVDVKFPSLTASYRENMYQYITQ